MMPMLRILLFSLGVGLMSFGIGVIRKGGVLFGYLAFVVGILLAWRMSE